MHVSVLIQHVNIGYKNGKNKIFIYRLRIVYRLKYKMADTV